MFHNPLLTLADRESSQARDGPENWTKVRGQEVKVKRFKVGSSGVTGRQVEW